MAPGSALTIAGHFDPNATEGDTTVTFTVQGGSKLTEWPISLTTTSIVVGVPMIPNTKGGLISKNASVTVTQYTSTGLTKTEPIKHLHISVPTKPAGPAGTVTEQFLQADESALASLRNSYQAIEAASPGTISSVVLPTFPAPGTVTIGALQGTNILQFITTLQSQLRRG